MTGSDQGSGPEFAGSEFAGPEFAGVRVGRPAARALVAAGYATLADLPEDLDALVELHGVGPRAVLLLRAAVGEPA